MMGAIVVSADWFAMTVFYLGAFLFSPVRLTILCFWAIIKTQGDARCEQAPPRGGNPTVATLHTVYSTERLPLST